MNSNAQLAYERLLAAGRVKDRARRLAWLVLVLATLSAVLLGSALVDYWLLLPAAIRGLSTALLVLLVIGGGLRFMDLVRHPASPKEVALDAESLEPGLGCSVSTAAEYLTGERKVVHEYEPQLVEALQAQVATALAEIKLPYWKRLQAPAVFMASALALLLVFILVASSALTAFQRVAFPLSNASYTQVTVKPGTTEIPVGRDLEIEALFRGRIPREATLYFRPADQTQWQSAKITPDKEGRGTHTLKAVSAPLTYRVRGGDGQSPEFALRTYVPPAVKELRINLEYPDYTKRPPQAQESPDITVVRASKAGFQITPTTELSQARLRMEKGPALALKKESAAFTGTLSITNSGLYWIELTDKANHLGVNEKAYHIKVLPDEPPKVEIVEPGEDIRADATNSIPVRISALDDFGVEEIKLVYHKLGGPEQTLVASVKRERNGEATATVDLPLTPLQLNEYELVAYHAEARDNNTLDGPGIGKSPLFFIEITNEEGGNCKSKCNGQKVNLLVIQKQIIADTQALTNQSPATVFKEIADRESEALHFGKMYLGSLTGGGAPAEAVSLMERAIQDMTAATVALSRNERSSALPPEESALARFYKIIKLLPELQDLPTEPPVAQGGGQQAQSQMVKVVLEAIKKQKQANPDNKQIAELLETLQQLRRSQSAVNQACENPSANPNGNSSGQRPADTRPSAQPAVQKFEAEQSPAATEQLAQQQEELSKEAAALAERLAKLAGKDARLGHNVTRTMNSTPGKMSAAAQAIRAGNRQSGFAHGKDTYYTLNTVISMLQKILDAEGHLADISSEEYPKSYEQPISDYLKRLSYQE